MLHTSQLLIEEGDIGGVDKDQELNFTIPLTLEFDEEEKRLQNIAKNPRKTLFQDWIIRRYKK
jgi:hypothetical protein